MQNNIKKDYFWNTLGVFAQNAISPLLLVVITRINGIYDSGVFSFAFSISIIFWALSMWGGRTYQVSDVNKEFSSRSYITVRLILSVVLIFGVTFFVLVNNYNFEKSSVLIVLVLFKAVESIADALYGVMQVNNRLFKSGVSLVCKSIFSISLFALIDSLTGDIFFSCLGILVINIMVVFVYDLPVTNRLEDISIAYNKIKYYVKQAIQLMKRCAPVFVVTFLAMFSLNIPRYFLDIYHQEEIGYFGILAMPITLIALLMSFILQPNVINLSSLFHKKNYTNFNKLVVKIIVITVLIGFIVLIATLVVGTQALQFIFGIDFSSRWLPLAIIVIGGIINALVSILINMLIIMRRIRAPFYILLITNIVLVFVSIVVIPVYSLIGGVYLFMIANILQLLLLFIVYRLGLRGV